MRRQQEQLQPPIASTVHKKFICMLWQTSPTSSSVQEVVKLPLEFVRQLSIKVQHQRPGTKWKAVVHLLLFPQSIFVHANGEEWHYMLNCWYQTVLWFSGRISCNNSWVTTSVCLLSVALRQGDGHLQRLRSVSPQPDVSGPLPADTHSSSLHWDQGTWPWQRSPGSATATDASRLKVQLVQFIGS